MRKACAKRRPTGFSINGDMPLPVRLGLRESLTNGWLPGTLARFALALGLSAAERSWKDWRAAFDDESPLVIAPGVEENPGGAPEVVTIPGGFTGEEPVP